LWNFLFPADGRNNLSETEKTIRNLIIEYYQKLDEIIGRIVSEIEGKANVIIMSDHGFGPLNGKIHINKWLEDLGLLSYERMKIHTFRLKAKVVPTFRQIVRKVDFLNLRKSLISRKINGPGRMGAYGFLDCIDWSKTVAYAASNTESGIYINLAGREPHGIVTSTEDWENARDLIITRLKELKHPQTGEKMVSRIYKREDIYSGPYMDNAPDIIFYLKEGEYIVDVQPTKYLIEQISWKTGTGTHRDEGIFIAYGKDVKNGLHIDGARMIDLAPTILNMMRLPIPSDMEGKPLSGIFSNEFLKHNPPRYVEPPTHSDKEADEFYSDKESAQLQEQLKGLGYL